MLNTDLGKKLNGLVEFIGCNYDKHYVCSTEVNIYSTMHSEISSSSSTELRVFVEIQDEGMFEIYAYRYGNFNISFIPEIKTGGEEFLKFCGKRNGSPFWFSTKELPTRYVCLCHVFYESVKEYLG